MNDCIRNKAGILIGLFTLLGCFAVRAQDIAVKTNLLYGGLLQTPNIGVEWGISPKLTVDLWGAYNPFPLGKNGYGSNNRKMKHWLIQSELRYWGLGDFRRQGNLAGFGFSYGYQWILSPHWSIEGTLGVGYAHLHYSKYPCKECGERLSVNNRNYLGPTRAAVSIIYLLK